MRKIADCKVVSFEWLDSCGDRGWTQPEPKEDKKAHAHKVRRIAGLHEQGSNRHQHQPKSRRQVHGLAGNSALSRQKVKVSMMHLTAPEYQQSIG